MKDLENRVAVVTGAASGIGKALASQLAAAGCRLAISDVNEKDLEALAQQLRANGHEVHSQVLDVADRQAFHDYADAIFAHYGAVNLIFNNAGVALGATVEAMEYDDFEWLMGINFWGVVHGTKAFLPYLKQSGEGHIVNVSSLFGLVGIPTQSAYNAAKFAVRGFTESLRMELDIEGSNVSCSCVHPGGIKTNIARNARMTDVSHITGATPEKSIADFEKLFRTTADEAAAIIISGARRNKRRILIGSEAYALDTMQRALPTFYQRLIVSGQKLMRKRAG